ncbi:MAG: hypothetical protein Q7U28_19240 [Aquabacterium sp.]|nr:hypothetical protein [Aquabacterium sp.]
MGQHDQASAAPAESDAGSAHQLVEGLIKDPRIVTWSWREMQRAFPEGCQKTPEAIEITCPPMNGVTRISAMSSGRGMVEIAMEPPVTCDELRAVVIKRFGSAKTTSTNGCSGDWDLGKYMKTGYLRISKGKKDPAKVTLQL